MFPVPSLRRVCCVALLGYLVTTIVLIVQLINLPSQSSQSDGDSNRLDYVLPLVGLFDDATATGNCWLWAVVTTIHAPSAAVRHVAQTADVCLVIVGDRNSRYNAADYLAGLHNKTANHVHYLSPDSQSRLFPSLSHALPWRAFARKNLGYLYARQRGARYIWDFDDDNLGIIDVRSFPWHGPFQTSCPDSHADNRPFKVINPYAAFLNLSNWPTVIPWPRGFPLSQVRRRPHSNWLCDVAKPETLQVGVIQSLANEQPDLDAIFRLTQPTPFNFDATPANTSPFLVPRFTYTPLNAQATLWTNRAFDLLYLPATVPDRVSDIWRSFVTLYRLHCLNISVLFTAPYVSQTRNLHNLMLDFHAELMLYERTEKFLQLLTELHRQHRVLGVRQLYESLVQWKLIPEKELHILNIWIQTYDYIENRLQ